MRHAVLSAATLLATAAAASAVVTPIYTSPPGAPLDPVSFAVSSAGDIVFLVGHDYYAKKHVGNVKWNEFKVTMPPGVVSPPNIGPDGTVSAITASTDALAITRITFDGSVTTAPLTANGSPADPASYQPVPTNGQSAGVTHIHVRQAPSYSDVISTRLDGSHLGETTPLDTLDGAFVGLSSHGHDVASARVITSPGGGMPVVKVMSDDGSHPAAEYQYPQFSSVGTPVIAAGSLFFVSTTGGIGGNPDVLAIETNPLYQPSGTSGTNPLYTGSARVTGIGTPAVNDAGDLAFVLTETDDVTHLPVKHIIHRDIAARTFVTDLSTGDPLMGSTVTDLYLSPDSVADTGDLLFYATLADGTSGLFVTTVPEPASLLTCGFAILPLTTRRRR